MFVFSSWGWDKESELLLLLLLLFLLLVVGCCYCGLLVVVDVQIKMIGSRPTLFSTLNVDTSRYRLLGNSVMTILLNCVLFIEHLKLGQMQTMTCGHSLSRHHTCPKNGRILWRYGRFAGSSWASEANSPLNNDHPFDARNSPSQDATGGTFESFFFIRASKKKPKNASGLVSWVVPVIL